MLRQTLQERWRTITSDVAYYRGERGYSDVNSEQWTGVMDTLGELAARMIRETFGEDEAGAVDLLVDGFGHDDRDDDDRLRRRDRDAAGRAAGGRMTWTRARD